LYQKAKKLVRDITNHTSQRLKVTFEHVYRDNNKIADGTLIQNAPPAAVFDCVLTIAFLCILSYPSALANAAMDGKRSWTTTYDDDDDDDDEETLPPPPPPGLWV
jgi:hypothetical protein